ncbi:MAG: glyoxalase superfamily protein, partial [Gammaproteobacteria bacterium]
MSQVLDEAKLRAIAQRLRNSTRFQEIVRCQLTGQQALEVVAMAHGYGSWANLQAASRDVREAAPAA